MKKILNFIINLVIFLLINNKLVSRKIYILKIYKYINIFVNRNNNNNNEKVEMEI